MRLQEWKAATAEVDMSKKHQRTEILLSQAAENKSVLVLPLFPRKEETDCPLGINQALTPSPLHKYSSSLIMGSGLMSAHID